MSGRDRDSSYALFETIGCVVTLLMWGACAGLGACEADGRDVRRTLNAEGYTEIELGEYGFFRCADTFNLGFTAVNPNGEPVTGTVCCGILSDCTVRW